MTDGAQLELQYELLKQKKEKKTKTGATTGPIIANNHQGSKEQRKYHPSPSHASSQSKAKQANTPANFHFTDFVIYLIMNLACSDKQVT